MFSMQHTVNIPPFTPPELEANPVFNVVIAYEDLESGKQAMQTYDFLAQKVGRDCHFTNQMWKFDVFGIPSLRDIAVKDAAMADIIIISSQGDKLPVQVKTWIESWLTLSGKAMALIALLRPAQQRTTRSAATQTYLAEVAKRAHMEFFAQTQQSAIQSWTGDALQFDRSASLSASIFPPFTARSQPDASMPRWGINE